MRAELQVFSGQPNPTWELTPAEVSELASRFHRLAVAPSPPPEPALGYRGVAVVNPSGAAGLPARMQAFGGVVSTTRSGVRVLLDDTEDIEPWLLDLGRARGHGPLVEQIVGANSSSRQPGRQSSRRR